jgi:SNF2 family DNA or RNA helicase
MGVAERRKSIDLFKTSEIHNILILSNVGMVGLNLACANILIMVVSNITYFRPIQSLIVPQDSLWSAMEEAQLIGRLHRYPQKRDIVVYRLLACDTFDVWLHQVSATKGSFLEWLAGAPPGMSKTPA